MTEKKPDLDAIVPAEGVVEIEGVKYKVKRLRLLELASLMRVVSVGAGPALAQLQDAFDGDEDMTSQVMAVLVVSLPNAIGEFVEFLNVVLVSEDGKSPEGLVNPDLDVLLDVVGIIVEQEKDDLPALVGKAKRLWSLQVKPLLPTGSVN